MTIENIKEIAESELNHDGVLSKALRVAILEKAKAGDHFEIEASHFDITRIGAELRRCSQGKRMRTKQIIPGKIYKLIFNTPK